MKKEKLSSDIIKASKAVRKKQLALKRGRIEEQSLLETQFKPITEPLKKLLKGNVEVKQESKTEFSPASPTVRKKPITPTYTPTSSRPGGAPGVRKSFTTELVYDPFTEEENDQVDDQNMIETQPRVVDDIFLDQYEMLPKGYIDGLLTDTTGEYDTTMGPYFDPVGEKLRLGKATLEIEGEDIVIDGIRYKGTPGLYELIFKTKPTGFKKEDQERYRDILRQTSAHHRDHDPLKQIKGSKSYKYMKIIKPLHFRQRTNTVSGRGNQIGNKMVVVKAPYQYVYWDDINELVDRLKLLIASEEAGHTSHANEIASIVEELKEAGVVY